MQALEELLLGIFENMACFQQSSVTIPVKDHAMHRLPGCCKENKECKPEN